MKKVLICGMLLAFLTSVSFAQRGGRGMSGLGATARTGNPAVMPNVGLTSHSGVAPNAGVGSISHVGVAPNVGVKSGSVTTMPNAVNSRPPMAKVSPTAPTGSTNVKTGTAPNAVSGVPANPKLANAE